MFVLEHLGRLVEVLQICSGSQNCYPAVPENRELLTLRASRRDHLQARGWRLQGNSWRLGSLLHRAPGGGLGPQKPLLESSWRALGGLQSRLGGSWRALGASWAVLEASWEVLGRSWRRIRGVLNAPWVVLEPSWELWKPCWSHLEAKRLPKWTPRPFQIELRRRLELKIAKPCFLMTAHRISMIFRVSDHHF